MRTSVRALLEGVFDYAGLFPPASLRMSEAAELYMQHLSGEESWIMDRFICPASRLNELGRYLAEYVTDPEDQWELAVVGTSPDAVREDLDSIEAFEHEFSEYALANCYELKAPEGLSPKVLKVLAEQDYDTFVEIPLGPTFSEQVAILAQAEAIGVKARLGGITPGTIPSVADVAEFIKLTSDLELPFKLTAGLHHPLRHVDPNLGPMHGFLNCLLAAAFTAHFDLTTTEIMMILDEQDPVHFEFDDEIIRIGDLDLEVDDLLNFRMLLGGIGSCSITEPIEGLSGIGPGAAKIIV